MFILNKRPLLTHVTHSSPQLLKWHTCCTINSTDVFYTVKCSPGAAAWMTFESHRKPVTSSLARLAHNFDMFCFLSRILLSFRCWNTRSSCLQRFLHKVFKKVVIGPGPHLTSSSQCASLCVVSVQGQQHPLIFTFADTEGHFLAVSDSILTDMKPKLNM